MLPSQTDPRWRKLVEQPDQYPFKFLALRILMRRVARRGGPSMSDADRDASIAEVVRLFEKNQALMGDDIAAIFG
jgi:hypothetical protein